MKNAVRTLVTATLLTTAMPACKKDAPRALPPDEVKAEGRVEVLVDQNGYHPSSIKVASGKPLTLVFTRVTDEGCGQKLVFPTLNIRRDLPLNLPVEVQVTPTQGSLAFTCGMDMYRGAVVVQ